MKADRAGYCSPSCISFKHLWQPSLPSTAAGDEDRTQLNPRRVHDVSDEHFHNEQVARGWPVRVAGRRVEGRE